MNPLATMKLHETIYQEGDTMSITKVPGGWIYRFLDAHQAIQPDGTWGESYLPTAVFVPYAPFDIYDNYLTFL